jgi:hypothetical protein
MDKERLQYIIPVVIILCCLGVGCVLTCLLMTRRRKLRKFRETLDMREENERNKAINGTFIDEQEYQLYEDVVCMVFTFNLPAYEAVGTSYRRPKHFAEWVEEEVGGMPAWHLLLHKLDMLATQ